MLARLPPVVNDRAFEQRHRERLPPRIERESGSVGMRSEMHERFGGVFEAPGGLRRRPNAFRRDSLRGVSRDVVGRDFAARGVDDPRAVG